MDRFHAAILITTLDLTQRHWQVVFEAEAGETSGFATHLAEPPLVCGSC